jgi:hypothetical protein
MGVMGVNRVFFPQQALDHWLEQGRISLVGDELAITPEGRRFRLTTAVRFMAEVAGTEDAHGLVGKVKSLEHVLAMSGEHYADSVILGDNAYQVIEGFLGEPLRAPPGSKTGKKRTGSTDVAAPDPLSDLFKH